MIKGAGATVLHKVTLVEFYGGIIDIWLAEFVDLRRVDAASRGELRGRVVWMMWLHEDVHLLSTRTHRQARGYIVAQRTRRHRFILCQQFTVLSIDLICRLLLLIDLTDVFILTRARFYFILIDSLPTNLIGYVGAVRLKLRPLVILGELVGAILGWGRCHMFISISGE